MTLPSFAEQSCAVVQGASRGIGQEFVRTLAKDQRFSRIIACCRRPDQADALAEMAAQSGGRVVLLELDVARPESIENAAKQVRQAGLAPALVLNVAGLLHDGSDVAPEKRLEDLSMAAMQRVFAVNTLGPALMMQQFLPLMTNENRAVFAVISARVGSISDNRLGGWYAYRSSKAALNQMLRTAAIEARRRFGNVIMAALHPGTTDTSLSRPFQARVPEDKLFTPEFSVEKMLQVIDGLEADDSGGFFAWDGKAIPW